MKRSISFIICIPFILTGCWSSQDVSESAFVQGVGLAKAGNQIKASVEIIKPTGGQAGQTGGKSSGQHIILEIKVDTLIEAAREFIRTAKRRLYFGHTNVFILSEELAREQNFPLILDIIRRDQMLRLNSYIFISDIDPSEVFHAPTLYENLSSTEIVAVLEQTKFIAEYTPINIFEFFRFLHDHHSNAYIPMITVQDSFNQKVSTLTGLAVIKDNQMVGKLNIKETTGLNWLLNQVKGGTITVMLDERDRASLEITKAKTKIVPQLDGSQLKVDIQTDIEGTVADNMTTEKLTGDFLQQLEKKISQEVQGIMLTTIKKLQELKTDIANFELTFYRKDPKAWKLAQSEWEEIFAHAETNIDVKVNITHHGLTYESLELEQQKPGNNPYRFLISFFRR